MVGTQLGPYRLLSELGSGGMGTVHLAEVAEAVAGLESGQKVAVKVVHPHLLASPGFFKRFLREADLGRTIEHANVVRTYDCDALLHDGIQQNFLVMEYVEGQTLRDLLRELERVPEELCRHVGREVAQGLAAIHEAGVVHRDLKPENVLLTPDHVVKVMDLGVARLQDEALRLSQAGDFVGSLEYAAPEQFRSADGEPDGRADLHALGVLLYELATGQHPYRDEDASKVIGNILEADPRKAGEVNPQLSPFLEEVVHTLIAKDREKRFLSASELAAVLDEGEQSDWWKARANALRLATRRPLRRIRIPRETALYGRDEDLARLHALYETARAGEGQVLLIEGEAGIGKTRLVDEFVGRLREEGEDINFLFGSYAPGGAATAAGAFSTAYREHFGSESLEATLAEYLKPTPVLIPAFAALLRGETSPKDAEPLTKDSLQTVFIHATRGLAAERTTIVLIDDLHFAPEEGRALFASLSLAVPDNRVLLVGTLRPGLAREWTANVTRLDHAEPRSLKRLGPKDLTQLLTDAFRSERLAEELAFRIAQKSDGNPFFAFEIIRGLREGQFIAQQADGTWATTRLIEEIQVPSSVMDLVQARIRDLPEEERDLLDAASCCGFVFDPGLVATVVGLPRLPALKQFGRIEQGHRLIRSTGRTYTFDHHQVQESLYAGLHEQMREEYHSAIAEALEARENAADMEPADLDGALCVGLCEHYLKGAKGERALRYLDAALDHLEAGYINEQTVALADRALGVPGLLQGEPRLKVLMRKNGPLDRLGRREVHREVLDEARALAEAVGERSVLVAIEVATGRHLWLLGSYEEAGEHFTRGLDIAREIGDRPREVNALVQIGHVFHRLGREEEAATHHQRALDVAKACGDLQGIANAESGLGNSAWARGRFEESRSHYERSLEIDREKGNRSGEAYSSLNLGNVACQLGLHEEARARYELCLAIGCEIGDRNIEAFATGNLGNVSFDLGRYGDAKLYYERALATHRETGVRNGRAVVLVNLGPLLLELGDRRRARETLEACLELCREIGVRYPEGYALWGLSKVAAEEGDDAQARDLAQESLALRREIGHGDGIRESLTRIGQLATQAGNPDAASSALREALALANEQQAKPAVAEVLALLARLPGEDPDAAEGALEEVGKDGSTMGVRYHLWEATGKREHLQEAKRLLDDLVEHAPEEYRESMRNNVRLHREIQEAWEEHGEKA